MGSWVSDLESTNLFPLNQKNAKIGDIFNLRQVIFVMLISFSFKNVSSFKDAQNLSMEISTLKKDDFLSQNTIDVANGTNLLKSALIYGANASGKTNLIKAIEWLKVIILSSYKNLEQNLLNIIIPFLLSENTPSDPSVFEIVFIENEIKYRYGISVFNGEILEEWLYFTPKSRETLLFSRNKQEIEFNKRNFSEIKLFVRLNQNSEKLGILERVANHIPLISVLAVFEGMHSQNTINFFNKIKPISGLNDQNLGGFTFNLIKNNKNFHHWMKPILKQFNINDLIVEEVELSQTISPQNNEPNIPHFNIKQKGLSINVQKHIINSEKVVEFPLEFESAGTCKTIHLLGPIYDSIKNNHILIIDEFDSKFHTLLSKYIFNLFHKYSKNSQLIVNVQDTNLMDTDYFRRDQIWFVDKNPITQDSQLYSLAEYKISKQKSYSQDYLNGAFDAIPLFSSFDEINSLMEKINE